MNRFRSTGQPDWDWWGKLWPAPGETLRQLGLSTGDAVLDIGSGNGHFALPAARIVNPGPVFALDLDAGLLEELAHLADQQAIENVVPVRGDARSLADHIPEPVDIGLVANTFHGIEEPAAFVEAVFDVLTDDGQFVVINWRTLPPETTTVAGDPRGPPTDLRLSPEDTEAIVVDAVDCTPGRSVTLPPYHYALTFER